MTQTVPFGKKFKETYFTNINPQYTAVNHGSYGLFPDKIFHRYVEEMKKDLYNPDNYVKVQQPETYKKALQTLGAVSYTHLDVYKRQVLRSETPKPFLNRLIEKENTVIGLGGINCFR